MIYWPHSIYCYCVRWSVCPIIQTIDESRAQLVANLQEQAEELAQLPEKISTLIVLSYFCCNEVQERARSRILEVIP